jgi:hypothetical protein
MGELYLELYSEEELMAGWMLFRQSLDAAVEVARSEGWTEVDVPKERAKGFILELDRYVTKLFTPERLDQLRARLDAVLRARAFEKEWFSFVFMLKHYMDKPDAVESECHFLVSAFVGEMRHAGEALENKLESEEEA